MRQEVQQNRKGKDTPRVSTDHNAPFSCSRSICVPSCIRQYRLKERISHSWPAIVEGNLCLVKGRVSLPLLLLHERQKVNSTRLTGFQSNCFEETVSLTCEADPGGKLASTWKILIYCLHIPMLSALACTSPFKDCIL